MCGKLFRHKPRPRKVTKAFSKNSERTVKAYPDGAVTRKSYLNGGLSTYSKTGRKIKTRSV